MTNEEKIIVSKEINKLMKWKKIELIELILNLERNNLNLTKKINELRNFGGNKNGCSSIK